MSSRSLSDIQTRAEVYVNQDKSLSYLQTLIKHSFLFNFLHELLMSILTLFIVHNSISSKLFFCKSSYRGPVRIISY
jgi:hypothetical protein